MRTRNLLLTGVLLAGVYAVLAPRNRTEAEDAYDYAWSVERASGPALLHPHHVAYLPLMKGLHVAASAVAGPVRAHPVMAAVSAGCAGAAVVLLAVLLAGPLGAGRGPAWGAAACLAASYGFWRYAAEAEIHAPMLLLALGSWAVAARAGRPPGAVLSGALGGAAVLLHVFAAIPVLGAIPLWLWMRRGLRPALTHGVVAAGLAAGVYACAGLSPLHAAGASAGGRTGSHTSQGVQRPGDGGIPASGMLPESSVRPGQRPGPTPDPTGTAGRAGPPGRPNGEPRRTSSSSSRMIEDSSPGDRLRREGGVSAASLGRAGIGLGQSLVSGNFLFAQPRFADAMQARYPARMLEEEVFMGRAARPWMRVVPWATLLVLLAAAGAVAMAAVRGGRAAANIEHRTSNDGQAGFNSQQPTTNSQHPTGNNEQVRMGVQRVEDADGGTSKDWKPAMAAGALWFAAHAGLVVWKEPGNPELWIAALPAVWIVAASIAVAARAVVWPAFALAAAMAVHNWAGGLTLLRDPAGDYNAAKASAVLAEARAGDVVLTAGGPVFFRHLRYRSPASVVDAWTEEGRGEVSGFRCQVSGAEPDGDAVRGRLLVLGDVFAPPPSLAVRFPVGAAGVGELAAMLRDRVETVRADAFGGVFRLRESGLRAGGSGIE